MPDLRRPAGERRGPADDGARGELIADGALALVTSAELPGLDDDSALLLPAFAALGVDARPVVWSDDAVDWSAFAAVLVRSTWDYFDRPAEFLEWVDRAGTTARRFLNPPGLVRWNAHKGYLSDLGRRGVPVVDTLEVAAGERATVPFDEGVVKPAVSGGSEGLRRVRGGEEVVAEVDLLVQPLLASIGDEGELSLLYADRELSHVVRKVPAPGDIRSQPEFGSVVTLEEPSDEAREAAAVVLDAIEGDLPYARVDLVRAADGTLRLIELEIIEPQLYLRWDPGAPERFARVLARAAGVSAAGA